MEIMWVRPTRGHGCYLSVQPTFTLPSLLLLDGFGEFKETELEGKKISLRICGYPSPDPVERYNDHEVNTFGRIDVRLQALFLLMHMIYMYVTSFTCV